MTSFFFQYNIGHIGGGWLQLCCNQHPAGMSVIAECHHKTCFDFEDRGIPIENYDAEVRKFFADRVHYGDACIGIIKSFHPVHIRWAEEYAGKENVKIFYIVRNPLFKFIGKWSKKLAPAAQHYRDLHGHPPKGETEIFVSALLYFRDVYYQRGITFAARDTCPFVRLEDWNRSMRYGGGFFKRCAEWFTGVEWPQSYIDHIRENWTAAYQYHNWLEWEDQENKTGRITKVVTLQRDEPTWACRDNWEDDPEPSVYWAVLKPWQQELYRITFADVERRLGYNQSGVGTLEDDWEFRNRWWGEVDH